MHRLFGILSAMLLAAFLLHDTSARAAYLAAWCEHDTVRVFCEVDVCDAYGDDLVGTVIVRDRVGLCDSRVTIPPEPVPCPGGGQLLEFRQNDLTAEPNVSCFYMVMGVDNAGQLHGLPGSGDPLPYDYASCGEALVTCGYVTRWPLWWDPSSTIIIQGCPGTCWPSWDFWVVPEGQSELFLSYLNTFIPLDIYGDPFIDGMPLATYLDISRFEPTPSGQCGPVPVVPLSWGRLKDFFR